MFVNIFQPLSATDLPKLNLPPFLYFAIALTLISSIPIAYFLGYTKDKNGHLIIDPEQAEVVKRIYREYLEGYSMAKIARHLEKDGLRTGAGKTKWHSSTINKILRNEKYIGDALLQKTYTTDFLTKTRVKNNGIVPQYYVENDHEAIIPKEIFMQVQAELVRRRVVHVSPSGKNRQAYDAIADEIFRLRDQKEKAENTLRNQKEVAERIKTLQEFIKRQPSTLTVFDESLVHKLIERITVFPKHFTVEFKSGISVDINE